MKRSAVILALSVVALGVPGASPAASVTLAGSLDPTFGTDGIVTGGPGSVSIDGIAVQPDGKIVVAGGAANGFQLTRYLPDGAPDPSFGKGGSIETQPASLSLRSAAAPVLQPDGKIVVGGSSTPTPPDGSPSAFTLARYDQDGSLDTSFGTGGIATTAIPIPDPANNSSFGAGLNALAVLPGGEILAGGSVSWVGNFDLYGARSVFVLARYRADGSLDSTFGTSGIVESGSAGWDSLGGIAVEPDGKIVASGYGDAGGVCGPCQPPTETMEVWRYEPDGSEDPTFDGPAATATELAFQGGPSTLQGGKIVVAGYTLRNQPVLERLEANGGLDTTFGKHGFAAIKYATGEPTAVLAQNDGKLLVSATNSSQGGGQWNTTMVIRLLPNGRLDPSFGKGGFVWLHEQAYAPALQPDQKILAGGGSGDTWVLDRVLGGNNCVVPDLRDKRLAEADVALERSYCTRGHVSTRFSRGVTRGRILSTAPRAGARLPGDTTVNLVVSGGKRP